ncbi:hypothetical protein ACSQ67_012349 [Phaseolus vulgaris]
MRSSVNPTLASDIWKRLFPPRRSRWLPLSGSVWVPIPNTGIRMGSNINLFKLCSALRVLGYFMILLFAAIVALSYYAVVLITWGPLLFRSPLQLSSFFSAFFVLLLFHILLILLTWSYLMVVLNDPGSVPHNWRHHQQLRSDIDLETAPPTPSPAYCSRCQNGKPPRCHHCSICKQLSLTFKFSSSFYCSPSPHHFLLSVGQREFGWSLERVKSEATSRLLAFVLPDLHFSPDHHAQLYTLLETTLDCLALVPSFIRFFGGNKNHSLSPRGFAVIFLASILNLAFALSLLCFVVMHISLLLSNTTSVEVHEKKKGVRWMYDLGWKRNFEQVFGTKKALWLFPMFSKEDLDNIPALRGIDFPTRSDVDV